MPLSVCELSAQKSSKILFGLKVFFSYSRRERREKNTLNKSYTHYIYLKRTLHFCLFGAVAPTSAACLYYPIGVYACIAAAAVAAAASC